MGDPPRILVVVDPTSVAQPALERGTWLARHFAGATLELFACISDSDWSNLPRRSRPMESTSS